MSGEPAFTGPADLETLALFDISPSRTSSVKFEDGAVTNWHSHEGGQVIYVVSGSGRYCERGGTEKPLVAGQHVIAAGGVDHYHGAAEGAALHHITVSAGETTWKEAPEL